MRRQQGVCITAVFAGLLLVSVAGAFDLSTIRRISAKPSPTVPKPPTAVAPWPAPPTAVAPRPAPPTVPPMSVARSASVDIVSFGEFAPERSGMVLARGATVRRDETTIDLGEDVALEWQIEGCGGSFVSASITGLGSVNPGTRQSTGGNCYRMTNRRAVNVLSDTTYTLRVAAPPAVAEKSFTVRVRRPILAAVQPVVDQEARTVTFYATNRGEVDLPPYPITGRYRLRGRSPSQPVFSEGTFASAAIGVPRGARVEVGSITFPEQAFRSSILDIEVQLTSNWGVTSGRGYTPFSQRFDSHTLDVSLRTLNLGWFSAQIRVNNHRSGTRDVERRSPHLANDVSVDINGHSSTFSLDPVHQRVGLTDFWFFVRNLEASTRGTDVFFLRDGKLGIRIPFSCSGSREVKGWATLSSGNWVDRLSPDLDVRRLELNVLLPLRASAGRITYLRPEVEVPSLNLHVAGGWAGLEPAIRGWLQGLVRGGITGNLSALLTTSAVRSQVSDELTGAVAMLASTRRMPPVTEVVGVRQNGDGLRITYR